ncbi:hypothetical protein Pla175_41310 [Pirellulimonas nuda]|uniref:Uncharacterized protein n=2 Tax=Pirellulimonas nuda TaxID=2528009 RepID=A0A518DGW5_9BACT|nr:hypothetical protein Pla175_41310 [Pirellulimonas nuda]
MKHVVTIGLIVLGGASGVFGAGETEHSSGNTDVRTPAVRRAIYARHAAGFSQPGIDLPAGGITKGRIAIDSDGNVFASDDLGAIPFGVGILWKKNLLGKVVHVGFNNNPNPDRWANAAKDQPGLKQDEEFAAIIAGTVDRFGLKPESVFNYANAADVSKATQNLVKEINASSADDPLYIVEAGAMKHLYDALAASDASRRPFVTVVSHSGWNDIECHDSAQNENIVDILRDFPNVKFDHIADQNRGLRARGAAGWDAIAWMKDSADPRVRWLHTCAQKGDPNRWGFLNLGTEVDISDAGMYYYLSTGREDADLDDLKELFSAAEPGPAGR